MGFGDFDDDDSEFRYTGSLPVLAGGFRRKIIGYFNGNIPPGMRTGREVRLVKLPELTWVYGFLMRAKEIGPVLYIKDGGQMEGVEGFHPIRSASEIRQSGSENTSQLAGSAHVKGAHGEVNLDEDFDALTDIEIPADLKNVLSKK